MANHWFVKGTLLVHPQYGELLLLTRLLTGKFVAAHYRDPNGVMSCMSLNQVKFLIQNFSEEVK